jgi:iron(III) transport system ATP-binding protein
MAEMLRIVGLVKRFPRRSGTPVTAVNRVELDIGEGRFFTLLGPSGCGKTTVLRCVAGLETPDAGDIELGGRTLFSARSGIEVRANERDVGMVFQSYAIWPHMTVFENAAFPLRVSPRRRRPGRRQLRERVERALAAVRLEELAGRSATDLSGGQQQRLALARALVSEPPLLLLDEPLSNLDARLREGMRFELKRLQAELGVTTVYVTHDQEEALAMSDVVAVMRDGAIEQTGTPPAVYERPASSFVADFIGGSNLIEGRVEDATDGGLVRLETTGGPLRAVSPTRLATGTRVMLAVRAERIAIEEAAASTNGENRLEGVVRAHAFLGDAVDHLVEVGALRLRVRGGPSGTYPPGTPVVLTFAPDAGALIPSAS